MGIRPPRIKTIIPTGRDYFAAFLPDKEHKIELRIEKIVCWSLIERVKPDESDEVVGQIIEGNIITEVTNVDDEEGFGELLGYFESSDFATQAIEQEMANRKDEVEEEEEEEEDEEDEEEDESDEDEEDEDEDEDEDDDLDDDDLDDDDLDDDEDEGDDDDLDDDEEDEDEG
jgi:hypothetical protein